MKRLGNQNRFEYNGTISNHCISLRSSFIVLVFKCHYIFIGQDLRKSVL